MMTTTWLIIYVTFTVTLASSKFAFYEALQKNVEINRENRWREMNNKRSDSLEDAVVAWVDRLKSPSFTTYLDPYSSKESFINLENSLKRRTFRDNWTPETFDRQSVEQRRIFKRSKQEQDVDLNRNVDRSTENVYVIWKEDDDEDSTNANSETPRRKKKAGNYQGALGEQGQGDFDSSYSEDFQVSAQTPTFSYANPPSGLGSFPNFNSLNFNGAGGLTALSASLGGYNFGFGGGQSLNSFQSYLPELSLPNSASNQFSLGSFQNTFPQSNINSFQPNLGQFNSFGNNHIPNFIPGLQNVPNAFNFQTGNNNFDSSSQFASSNPSFSANSYSPLSFQLESKEKKLEEEVKKDFTEFESKLNEDQKKTKELYDSIPGIGGESSIKKLEYAETISIPTSSPDQLAATFHPNNLDNNSLHTLPSVEESKNENNNDVTNVVESGKHTEDKINAAKIGKHNEDATNAVEDKISLEAPVNTLVEDNFVSHDGFLSKDDSRFSSLSKESDNSLPDGVPLLKISLTTDNFSSPVIEENLDEDDELQQHLTPLSTGVPNLVKFYVSKDNEFSHDNNAPTDLEEKTANQVRSNELITDLFIDHRLHKKQNLTNFNPFLNATTLQYSKTQLNSSLNSFIDSDNNYESSVVTILKPLPSKPKFHLPKMLSSSELLSIVEKTNSSLTGKDESSLAASGQKFKVDTDKFLGSDYNSIPLLEKPEGYNYSHTPQNKSIDILVNNSLVPSPPTFPLLNISEPNLSQIMENVNTLSSNVSTDNLTPDLYKFKASNDTDDFPMIPVEYDSSETVKQILLNNSSSKIINYHLFFTKVNTKDPSKMRNEKFNNTLPTTSAILPSIFSTEKHLKGVEVAFIPNNFSDLNHLDHIKTGNVTEASIFNTMFHSGTAIKPEKFPIQLRTNNDSRSASQADGLKKADTLENKGSSKTYPLQNGELNLFDADKDTGTLPKDSSYSSISASKLGEFGSSSFLNEKPINSEMAQVGFNPLEELVGSYIPRSSSKDQEEFTSEIKVSISHNASHHEVPLPQNIRTQEVSQLETPLPQNISSDEVSQQKVPLLKNITSDEVSQLETPLLHKNISSDEVSQQETPLLKNISSDEVSQLETPLLPKIISFDEVAQLNTLLAKNISGDEVSQLETPLLKNIRSDEVSHLENSLPKSIISPDEVPQVETPVLYEGMNITFLELSELYSTTNNSESSKENINVYPEESLQERSRVFTKKISQNQQSSHQFQSSHLSEENHSALSNHESPQINLPFKNKKDPNEILLHNSSDEIIQHINNNNYFIPPELQYFKENVLNKLSNDTYKPALKLKIDNNFENGSEFSSRKNMIDDPELSLYYLPLEYNKSPNHLKAFLAFGESRHENASEFTKSSNHSNEDLKSKKNELLKSFSADDVQKNLSPYNFSRDVNDKHNKNIDSKEIISNGSNNFNFPINDISIRSNYSMQHHAFNRTRFDPYNMTIYDENTNIRLTKILNLEELPSYKQVVVTKLGHNQPSSPSLNPQEVQEDLNITGLSTIESLEIDSVDKLKQYDYSEHSPVQYKGSSSGNSPEPYINPSTEDSSKQYEHFNSGDSVEQFETPSISEYPKQYENHSSGDSAEQYENPSTGYSPEQHENPISKNSSQQHDNFSLRGSPGQFENLSSKSSTEQYDKYSSLDSPEQYKNPSSDNSSKQYENHSVEESSEQYEIQLSVNSPDNYGKKSPGDSPEQYENQSPSGFPEQFENYSPNGSPEQYENHSKEDSLVQFENHSPGDTHENYDNPSIGISSEKYENSSPGGFSEQYENPNPGGYPEQHENPSITYYPEQYENTSSVNSSEQYENPGVEDYSKKYEIQLTVNSPENYENPSVGNSSEQHENYGSVDSPAQYENHSSRGSLDQYGLPSSVDSLEQYDYPRNNDLNVSSSSTVITETLASTNSDILQIISNKTNTVDPDLHSSSTDSNLLTLNQTLIQIAHSVPIKNVNMSDTSMFSSNNNRYSLKISRYFEPGKPNTTFLNSYSLLPDKYPTQNEFKFLNRSSITEYNLFNNSNLHSKTFEYLRNPENHTEVFPNDVNLKLSEDTSNNTRFNNSLILNIVKTSKVPPSLLNQHDFVNQKTYPHSFKTNISKFISDKIEFNTTNEPYSLVQILKSQINPLYPFLANLSTHSVFSDALINPELTDLKLNLRNDSVYDDHHPLEAKHLNLSYVPNFPFNSGSNYLNTTLIENKPALSFPYKDYFNLTSGSLNSLKSLPNIDFSKLNVSGNLLHQNSLSYDIFNSTIGSIKAFAANIPTFSQFSLSDGFFNSSDFGALNSSFSNIENISSLPLQLNSSVLDTNGANPYESLYYRNEFPSSTNISSHFSSIFDFMLKGLSKPVIPQNISLPVSS